MDNFNRVLSFIIGFIVIAVILVIIIGRLNLKERFASIGNSIRRVTITPSPRVSPTITPYPTQYVNNSNGTPVTGNGSNGTYSGTTPNKIPSTGAPTLLIPLAMGGIYLGKKLKYIKK